jgi:hypothetical protein
MLFMSFVHQINKKNLNYSLFRRPKVSFLAMDSRIKELIRLGVGTYLEVG